MQNTFAQVLNDILHHLFEHRIVKSPIKTITLVQNYEIPEKTE